MYKKLFFLALVLLPFLGIGQGNLGSPYTRYGLGDIENGTSVRDNAMGGASIVSSSKTGVNFDNPASYSVIDSMTFVFEMGLSGGVRNYATTDLSANKVGASLSYLTMAFPVTKWWASSIGLTPYSVNSYDIASSSSSYDIDKQFLYNGEGGINRVYWGNSFEPYKGLRLGVNLDYYFGKHVRANSIEFNDTTGVYVDLLQQNIVRVSDVALEFGLQYEFKVNQKNSLLFGATFSPQMLLNCTQSNLVTNSNSSGSSDIVDTIFYNPEQKETITLPLAYAIGVGWNFNNKLILQTDYRKQHWENALFYGNNDSIANSSRISLGLEYTPAGLNNRSFNYWEGVSYRIGGHYSESYFRLENDDQLKDFGISFGLGLPLKRSRSAFNVSVELGQRGTTDYNLLRERYAIIGINFALNDIWFVKRKFD